MSKAIAYRPEIDGLRTVAVAGVILFHLDESWLRGGFLGVDVFFVISGFLITSIIYAQMLQGTFSLPNFWMRRIKRLYPALAVMVGVVLLFGAFFLIRPERQDLPLQALAAVFSFENILLWQTTGGYWSSASENIALLHAWSLSLEEQFYICFPILLLVINRFAKRQVLWVLVGLFCISLALSVYGTEPHRNATFYLLPTRMWELLFGSVLAVYGVRHALGEESRWAQVWQVLGLGVIVMSFFWIENDVHFPSWWPVFPCVGTLLILMYGSANGPVKSLLASAPIVYVGKISYSLYLWHWPVIVFLKYVNPVFNPYLALILTLSLASLSYHFVECPFRQGFKRMAWVSGLAVGLVALCFVPILVLPTSPLMRGLGDLDSERSLTRGWVFEALEQVRNGAVPEKHVDVCVVGSSHARVLCPPIAAFAREHHLSFLSLATSGVGVTTMAPTPLTPDADRVNAQRFQVLAEVQAEVVVVAGMWSDEIIQNGFEPILQKNLARLCAQAKMVIVLGQVPLVALPDGYDNAMRKYLVARYFGGYSLTLTPSEDVKQANQIVANIVRTLGIQNIYFLNPYPLFVNVEGDIDLFQEGQFLYSDFHHVNDAGANLIFEALLQEAFRRLLLSER